MSEKAANQASSKEDLDQLSALEESMAPFGMGDLHFEHGVILKDWSAQDFANIYVRFRPHLISHARKFLREETQAEEVVQDAFLYLMTALPELDSELGVLRFLKWKTKMLCLDIIRSSQAGLSNNLVPLPDDVADETQPLDSLERADDAAIIRLALAKLNPRHREALIATMYEEKSYEEVAQQMGVGENAFRQLLFRARASFRQALVGEAEIEGKTVAEILSIAGRIIRNSPRAVGVTLLVLGLGFLPGLLQTEPSGLMNANQSDAVSMAGATADQEQERGAVSSKPSPQARQGESIDVTEQNTDNRAFESPGSILQTPVVTKTEVNPVRPAISLESQPSESLHNLEKARDMLGPGLLDTLTVASFELELKQEATTSWKTLEIQSSTGLSGSLGLDLLQEPKVHFAWFELSVDDIEFALVPRTILVNSNERAEGTSTPCSTIVFTDFVAGTTNGELGSIAVAETQVGRNAVILELCVNSESGEMAHSSLFISNKT